MTGWALEPVELPVECGGQTHRLRWAEGELRSLDHADAEGERTLAALGGEPSRCVQLLDAWARHADDPDVLLLASRGPSDPLAGPDDPSGPGGAGMSFMPPGAYRSTIRTTAAARPGARVTRPRASGSGRGWFAYAPLNGPSPGAVPGLAPVEPEQEVEALLGLGSGLPERLVAGVIAAWAERLAAGDDRSRAAGPALQAALYGRALAALRSWLGEPGLDVDLSMVPPDALRSLCRDDAGLHLSLPFAWLGEVWVPGLATVLGRFCLAAEQTDDPGGAWRLTVIGPDLGPPRGFTLVADPG